MTRPHNKHLKILRIGKIRLFYHRIHTPTNTQRYLCLDHSKTPTLLNKLPLSITLHLTPILQLYILFQHNTHGGQRKFSSVRFHGTKL